MRQTKLKVKVAVLGGAMVCLALGSLSGCYKKVISARGIGADASYPERSESSEPEIDKAIDGLFEEKGN